MNSCLFALGAMSVTNSINRLAYSYENSSTNLSSHAKESTNISAVNAKDVAQELHKIQQEEKVREQQKENERQINKVYNEHPWLRELDQREQDIKTLVLTIGNIFKNGAIIFCTQGVDCILIPFSLADHNLNEAYVTIFNHSDIYYMPAIALERWIQNQGYVCNREKIDDHLYIKTTMNNILNFLIIKDEAMTFSLNESQIVNLRNFLKDTNRTDILEAMNKSKAIGVKMEEPKCQCTIFLYNKHNQLNQIFILTYPNILEFRKLWAIICPASHRV